VVLHWCYTGVTVVSTLYYSGVTVVLQWCYSVVTIALQWFQCTEESGKGRVVVRLVAVAQQAVHGPKEVTVEQQCDKSVTTV
jgi:hypothetical protein